DILEQVPDELLEHQHAFGKTGHVDLGDENEEELGGAGRDLHFGEETRESAYNRGPLYAARHEEFDDSDEALMEDVVEAEPIETTITIEEEFVPRVRPAFDEEVEEHEGHVHRSPMEVQSYSYSPAENEASVNDAADVEEIPELQV